MDRIIRPLTHMGARITARGEDRLAPMAIKGGGLRGIEYELPVASGMYIAHIEMPGINKSKILKLAIVQEQQFLENY